MLYNSLYNFCLKQTIKYHSTNPVNALVIKKGESVWITEERDHKKD